MMTTYECPCVVYVHAANDSNLVPLENVMVQLIVGTVGSTHL